MGQVTINKLTITPFLLEEVAVFSSKVRQLPSANRDNYSVTLQVPDLLSIANAYVLDTELDVVVK